MTTFQITTFTGALQNQAQTQLLVNARDLHERLRITTKFQDWIKRRISDYGFIKNEDYICFSNLRSEENKGITGFWGGQNKIDYHITLDMAKELCMLERSELGQQARRYFIQKEKEANALKAAQPKAEMTISTTEYIELLKSQNALLKQRLEISKPRRPNIPLTLDEKRQILFLHEKGLSHKQIAEQVKRSPSAVRAVIREQ